MSDTQIRNWMQRSPQPDRLRTDTGEVILLSGRRKWEEAMKAIGAMQPNSLEALNKEGAVIRVYNLDETSGTRIGSSAESELVLLSRIISEAHDKGASRHEAAYKLAFESLLTVTKEMVARLTKLEQTYMHLMERHAKAMEDAAMGNEGGDLDALASAFLLNRLSGGGGEPPKPNPKPNGKPGGGQG